MGFSWGGAEALAAAEEYNVSQFGDGIPFAAHIAHYPSCWGSNRIEIPGAKFENLTGAPILIQIREEDDYDNGSAPCFALKKSLDPEFQSVVEVISYEGAYHAWDKLEVPFTAYDPFANRGYGGDVEVVPDVAIAYESRKKVVRFFRRHL
jgi:dienelactone hydrolase